MDPAPTLIAWILVTYFAWRLTRGAPRPILRFCWFYVLVTPLPIQFLIGRDQACLYVTLAGWAVLGATLFADWLASATGVLSAEAFFGRMGQKRIRNLLVF